MALGLPGPSWAQAGSNSQKRPSVPTNVGRGNDLGYDAVIPSPLPPARLRERSDGGLGSGIGSSVGQDASAQKYASDMIQYNASQAMPGLIDLQRQQADLVAQLGFGQASYGMNTANLRQDYGLSMRGIGLDQASLGLNREGIGVDRDRNNLNREGVGLDMVNNQQDRDYINRLRGFLGRDRGDAEKDYRDRSGRISFDGQDKARQIKSENVGRGSFFSPFHRLDQGANYLRTLNDLSRNDTSYRREVTGFDRTDAGFDRDFQRSELNDQQARLKLRGIDLDDRELGIAERQLGVQAERLGLSADQLRAQLDQGLKRLGMDSMVDAFGVANALESNSAQQQAWAYGVLAQAVEQAGVGGPGRVTPPPGMGDMYRRMW
jgi:hypothetical protein